MNNRISFYALMYALERALGPGISEFEDDIRQKYRESRDRIRITESEGMLYLIPYQWPLDDVQDPATVEDPNPIDGVDEEALESLKEAQASLRRTLEDSIVLNYNVLGSATNLYISKAELIKTILDTDIQVIMSEHGLQVPSVVRGTDLETKGGGFSPVFYRPTGFVVSLIPEMKLTLTPMNAPDSERNY